MSFLDDTQRFTVCPVDGTVYMDQGSYGGLDFSNIVIPSDISVLHWKPQLNMGWIEYVEPEDPFTQTKPDNLRIEELPQWALECYTVWEQRHTQNS